MRFQIFQVTVGLGFPPLPKPTLIDVFKIAFGGRSNNEFVGRHLSFDVVEQRIQGVF